MEELKANIKEVAQVLLSINVPIGLFAQIGDPIQKCSERLNFIARSINVEEQKHDDLQEEQEKKEEPNE